MSNQNQNEQPRKNGAPDVLAYNTRGIPLSMGIFVISKEETIKAIDSLASGYIGGEYQVKIDTWIDKNSTEYDDDAKTNRNPIQMAFQVWIPKKNQSIYDSEKGNNTNVFLSEGIATYSVDFKKFVNSYGIQGEKGNAMESIGKKNGKIIVCLDPSKIFGLFFDMTSKAYNEENPNNKNNRQCEVRAAALYEGDNPIEVALGRTKRARRSSTLTGFLIRKTYKAYGGGDDKYRPSFNTRKKKY